MFRPTIVLSFLIVVPLFVTGCLVNIISSYVLSKPEEEEQEEDPDK